MTTPLQPLEYIFLSFCFVLFFTSYVLLTIVYNFLTLGIIFFLNMHGACNQLVKPYLIGGLCFNTMLFV